MEGIKKRVLKSTPAQYTKPLDKKTFKHKDYTFPKDYDAYLTNRYKNWSLARKEMGLLVDDQAVIERDYSSEEELY